MGLMISVDGTRVSGLMQAVITTTNFYSSDHFSLTLALGDLPLTTAASWASLSTAYVEVCYTDALFPDLNELITGYIDALAVDPILKTASLEGRDLSSNLIDSYLQQDFVNQTASEIVESIASRHGLTTDATPTFGNIGRYFGDGFTKLSLGQFSNLRSEWDLMVQLAREQEFDIYVQGTCLIFRPVTASAASAVTLIGPGDLTSLRLERNLAIEPSVKVRVQSWNCQQMNSYNSGASGSLSEPNTIDSQTYLFSRSNLTPSQADLSAKQYMKEISRLRSVIHVEMPWNAALSARSILLLEGTESAFDGLYQIDSMERRYSSISGSSQSFRAISWPASGET